jgi:alkanesulfonate monooxygenase SsuD/methylene tetrahydromethanopterin reductase-like flavin-dependent oxidoreductase (luciferase family)
MTTTQTPERVRVGVLLTPPSADLGAWLADAAAFDAAGVDALWVETAGDAGLDPLAIVAALTTLTFRSLLVTGVPADVAESPARARTIATIGHLSHGRFALCGERGRLDELCAAVGDRPTPQVFYRLDDDVFLRPRVGRDPERWIRSASPDGRAAWRAIVAGAAERQASGLLVPSQPRLLDILRNPDGLQDRQDLHIAQG